MLSREKMQLRRSPGELRVFAEEIRIAASMDPDEWKQGVRKWGLYKQYFDELLPLSRFAEKRYPENWRIEPIPGSQGYDAKVFDQSGQLADRVEVTRPHDGESREIVGSTPSLLMLRRAMAEHPDGIISVSINEVDPSGPYSVD